ncbi:hypothetical protein TKK_0005595 [Trichogramma kaykai]
MRLSERHAMRGELSATATGWRVEKKKKTSHIQPQLTVDDIRSRLRHRVKEPSELVQVMQVSVPSDLKNCVMQTSGSLCDNEASASDKTSVSQVPVNLFSVLPALNAVAVSAVVSPPPRMQVPSKCRDALHEEYLVEASVDNATKQLKREGLKLRTAQQRALMRPAEPLENIFLPGLPISDATYQAWLRRTGDFRFEISFHTQ